MSRVPGLQVFYYYSSVTGETRADKPDEPFVAYAARRESDQQVADARATRSTPCSPAPRRENRALSRA